MKRELTEQELRLISILLDPDLDESFDNYNYDDFDYDNYDDCDYGDYGYDEVDEIYEPESYKPPEFDYSDIEGRDTQQEFEQDIENSDRYSR